LLTSSFVSSFSTYCTNMKAAKGMRTGGTMTAGKGMKLAGGLPMLLLAFGGWAVALAGLAVMDHANGGESGDAGSLEFPWWVVFFDLFVLLCVLIHFIEIGLGFGIGRVSAVALLAVVEVLKMLQCDRFNQERKFTNGQYKKGAQTAFAGFLIAAVAEGILIILLGAADHADRSGHQHDSHDHNYTGNTTATARPIGTAGTHTTGTTGATGGTMV